MNLTFAGNYEKQQEKYYNLLRMNMKNKIMSLVLLFLRILKSFTRSKKDEVESVPTTGGLVVKVKLPNSTGYVTGVDVGLSKSQKNLDKSVYLKEVRTDNGGKANFGQLYPGNYYYDCIARVSGVNYYGEGQIQITVGNNHELTLILQ